MTYDNTDERGEDAVARQRGGSEPGHLPECPETPGIHYDSKCICDRLRACEARVFVDRTDHWNAALDAARDAVDAVWSAPDGLLRGLCNHADALAAIDALRGEA